MTLVEFIAALRGLLAQADGTSPAPAPVGPVNTPAVPVNPAITFKMYHNGKVRVDDIMPDGMEGTQTQALTKHVLSLPSAGSKPDGTWDGTGEGFLSYLMRVCKQAGWGDPENGIDIAGGGINTVSGFWTAKPNEAVAQWASMADQFFNLAKYSGQSDAEQAMIAAQWAELETRLRG